MATLFVRHAVNDFDTFFKVYNDFDPIRQEAGVTGAGMYQMEGNPNDVVIYHHFESMDAAKAFMADPRLASAMESAGVVGEPTVWFTTKV
jgi:quinol monooxygenase YgiN